jgi:hypothetical protein
LKQEWQKSPAGTKQTDGKNLVWFGEIERKISQIIKDYFYLPFFLLIILCVFDSLSKTQKMQMGNFVFAKRALSRRRLVINLGETRKLVARSYSVYCLLN